jgi:hypothetical protein
MIDNGDIIHEVHLNLPKVFKRNNTTYPEVKSPHPLIKIFTGMEDEGPATKLLPTLDRFRDEDVLIISIDDDTYYNKIFFDLHCYFNNKYENKIISTFRDYNNEIIPQKINENNTINIQKLIIPHRQTFFIEGFSSVAYPSKLINPDNIRSLIKKSKKCMNSDDLIISKYLVDNNLPIINIGNNLNLLFIKQQDWGFEKDALHNIQNHKNKYIECLEILEK